MNRITPDPTEHAYAFDVLDQPCRLNAVDGLHLVNGRICAILTDLADRSITLPSTTTGADRDRQLVDAVCRLWEDAVRQAVARGDLLLPSLP